MSNVEKTSEAQAKEDHLLQEHLDHIWDQYSITRNPTFLAAFVRLGGDISDEETRNLIADLLETAKFKHSRARPNANASFYLDVKELVSQHLKDDKGKDLSENAGAIIHH